MRGPIPRPCVTLTGNGVGGGIVIVGRRKSDTQQKAGIAEFGPISVGQSSATVMTMGVAQVYGDAQWADSIAQVGEVVRLPWTMGGKKRYTQGVLPLGEIMVAYAHVARPWFAVEHKAPTSWHVAFSWRWPVHAVTLLLLLLTLVIAVRLKRGEKRRADAAKGGE